MESLIIPDDQKKRLIKKPERFLEEIKSKKPPKKKNRKNKTSQALKTKAISDHQTDQTLDENSEIQGVFIEVSDDIFETQNTSDEDLIDDTYPNSDNQDLLEISETNTMKMAEYLEDTNIKIEEPENGENDYENSQNEGLQLKVGEFARVSTVESENNTIQSVDNLQDQSERVQVKVEPFEMVDTLISENDTIQDDENLHHENEEYDDGNVQDQNQRLHMKIKALESRLHTLECENDVLRNMWNDDQIQVLMNRNVEPLWSEKTLMECIQMKSFLGQEGYHYLIERGFPLPKMMFDNIANKNSSSSKANHAPRRVEPPILPLNVDNMAMNTTNVYNKGLPASSSTANLTPSTYEHSILPLNVNPAKRKLPDDFDGGPGGLPVPGGLPLLGGLGGPGGLTGLSGPHVVVKKKNYTTEFKLMCVEEAKHMPLNQCARKHQINSSSLRGWRKQEAELRQLFESPAGKNSFRLKGGGCKVRNIELEEAVFSWALEMRTNFLTVSRSGLKNKALEIAQQREIQDFKASEGWLCGFIKRYGMSFRAVNQETEGHPELNDSHSELEDNEIVIHSNLDNSLDNNIDNNMDNNMDNTIDNNPDSSLGISDIAQ